MAKPEMIVPTLLLACIGIIIIALAQPIAGSRWDEDAGSINMTGNITEMKPFMGKCPVNETCMVMEPEFAVCPADDGCVKLNCQSLQEACPGTNETTGKTCYKVEDA